MASKLDAVIDKVQKLLNVANSSDKPGEVAAAQLLAQQLITKYQLEEAQLHGNIRSGEITSKNVPISEPYSIDKATLLNSIAIPNFCKVLRGDGYCVIYGFESDIELCLALYHVLELHMVTEMQAKLAIVRQSSSERIQTKPWAKSFFSGYALNIGLRIKQAKSNVVKEAGSSGASLELVLRDKQHAIEEFWQQVDREKGYKRKLSSTSAYQAGMQSAANADLNQTKIESE